MLALTDEGRKHVSSANSGAFARGVIAALLHGRTISHATVQRACAQAQAFALQSHACCLSWGFDDDAA
jgi:hypothetical protein